MCDGPEEPPPGRFGFKKHAGLIRVNNSLYIYKIHGPKVFEFYKFLPTQGQIFNPPFFMIHPIE